MRKKYIDNLMDDLIRRNHLRVFWDSAPTDYEFVKFAMRILSPEFAIMRPETLGRIMASFEVGQVLTKKDELFSHLDFNGDCEDLQRDLTALCFAYAVKERFVWEDRENPDM